MRTVIIALPVSDDADIFEIADQMNEAFPIHDPDEDEETQGSLVLDECVVYESVDALLDDLGVESEPRDIIREAALHFLHGDVAPNPVEHLNFLHDLAEALGVDGDDVEAL